MLTSISYARKASSSQAPAQDSSTQEKNKISKSADFDSLLKGLLVPDKDNNVSEEELFAALCAERISALKGEDAAASFKKSLEVNTSAQRKADGFVPMEQVALASLREMISGGVLSAEEADAVYAQAFSAAQLDTNSNALYDNRGGGADKTIAVAKLEAGIAAASALIDKFVSGETAVTDRDLSGAVATGSAANAYTRNAGTYSGKTETIKPRGTLVDGPDGFLFKPVSVNEGRLAVLLGAEVTGHVLDLSLMDKGGQLIERGRLQTAGIAETGREKYTFSKSGGSYQKNLQVQVTFDDGSVKTYKIPNPSQRYD